VEVREDPGRASVNCHRPRYRRETDASIAKKIAGFYVPELAPRTRAALKRDPESLRSYAGDYRLEDRFTIKVTVAGDRLETIWRGQNDVDGARIGEQLMVDLVEDVPGFFEEDSVRTFRFTRDDNGKVSALIIALPEELTLRKLP
jgi:hypothetical protein